MIRGSFARRGHTAAGAGVRRGARGAGRGLRGAGRGVKGWLIPRRLLEGCSTCGVTCRAVNVNEMVCAAVAGTL